MPYNVHAVKGKMKGKFVRQRVKSNVEAFVKRTEGKQGRVKVEQTKVEIITNINTQYKRLDERRVIELDKLAKDMLCNLCNLPVSSRFVLERKLEGVASKYRIKCQNCNNIIQVEASKKTASKMYYDSNLKLAVGMLDHGLGETKVNTVLSALNIPAVESTSLKRWEEHVGSTIEELASKTCVDAIEEEKH